MFAKRKIKKKENKRRRDEDNVTDATNKSNEEESNEVSDGDDESTTDIIRKFNSSVDRNKINKFSTNRAIKRSKELMEARYEHSKREIVPQKYAGDATYESQIDTEKDRDTRAILERNIAANKAGAEDSGKIYRGQAGYKNYANVSEAQIGMNKYTGTQGPIRAQTWARSICRFDYQPDICKDYKETGFCGYGDSCKFLHDRGDYKSGWQQDREYSVKEAKKKKQLVEGGRTAKDEDEDENEYFIGSDNDEEQFACTICRNSFHNAVVTICSHYFCESCALKQYKKSSRCFNCNSQTNGVFNVAHKIREKEKREREEKEDKKEDKRKSIEQGGWAVVDE